MIKAEIIFNIKRIKINKILNKFNKQFIQAFNRDNIEKIKNGQGLKMNFY